MASRYTVTAAALHWATAGLLLINIALGWWMSGAIEHEASRAAAIEWFQIHKSIGMTVLGLTLIRIFWRLAHRPPPLPSHMRRPERVVARATHLAFYITLIAIPLSGWIYASTQWRGDAPLSVPTLYFGFFEVPHIGGLGTASDAVRENWAYRSLRAHQWLAWSTAALAMVHIGAAIKHQFVDHDDLLTRMLPRVSMAKIASASLLVGAGVLVALLLAQGSKSPAERSSSGTWQIDATASEIAWLGRHAGKPFRGVFQSWSATINFDPASPATSAINATIQMDSATDGVALHDRTLPQKEWFDVTNHPTATYRSTRIEAQPNGTWRMSGVLQIKTHSVELPPLTLSLQNNTLRITGSPVMDRRDAEIGTVSDPNATWVSADITIEVDITAVR